MLARRVMTAVAVIILLVGLVMFVNQAAQGAADRRPCLTNSEWGRLYLGMPRADVRELLDGDGHYDSHNLRWYRICGKNSRHIRAYIYYRDGRMDAGWWLKVTGATFIKSDFKLVS